MAILTGRVCPLTLVIISVLMHPQRSADPTYASCMTPRSVPLSFESQYGAGLDRGLVLGGGGLFFIAWQVAYLDTLARAGVTLAGAQRVVGTSAGSLIAAVVTSGGIGRFARTVSLLSRAPALTARLAPAARLAPSQQRAWDLFRQATDAEPETVQAIGRAALAAAATPAASMRRTARLMIAHHKWPAPSLQVTAVDTYTGERIVIDHHAQVPVATATAASSSVPGLFAPQLVGDRFCMDGGVSGSGTHSDLVAGADRVVMISLSEAFPSPRPGGMTQRPGGYQQELDNLQASGSKVLVVGPESADLTTLMDPREVPAALAMGRRQAQEDVDRVRDFWR